MDMINFDRYDMIIGTRDNKVQLYFDNDEVIINRVATSVWRLILDELDVHLQHFCTVVPSCNIIGVASSCCMGKK